MGKPDSNIDRGGRALMTQWPTANGLAARVNTHAEMATAVENELVASDYIRKAYDGSCILGGRTAGLADKVRGRSMAISTRYSLPRGSNPGLMDVSIGG